MKISKIFYFTGLAVGVVLAVAGQPLWGFGAMILGLFLFTATNPEINSIKTYNQPTYKKPYYKNEFEEYQHYKIVNKK